MRKCVHLVVLLGILKCKLLGLGVLLGHDQVWIHDCHTIRVNHRTVEPVKGEHAHRSKHGRVLHVKVLLWHGMSFRLKKSVIIFDAWSPFFRFCKWFICQSLPKCNFAGMTLEVGNRNRADDRRGQLLFWRQIFNSLVEANDFCGVNAGLLVELDVDYAIFSEHFDVLGPNCVACFALGALFDF